MVPIIVSDGDIANALNIISRNQTWMVLVTFLLGTVVGFVDDLIVTGKLPALSKICWRGTFGKIEAWVRRRLGAIVGWWMYANKI